MQIDVPETLDIADRAGFYDATGAALDMLVTHLFQVAAEVAMEPPARCPAEDLQVARESVIAAFRPLDPAEVVLGQFDGYRQTEGDRRRLDHRHVRRRQALDRHRPLARRAVPAAHRQAAGGQRPAGQPGVPGRPKVRCTPPARLPNVLAFDLKGSGAIEMQLTVKKPGPDLVRPRPAPPSAWTNVAEGAMAPYTSLIYDVLSGDRSLFTSSEGLKSAFTAFAPLLGPDRPEVQPYDDGSWGPAAADGLTGHVGWQLR